MIFLNREINGDFCPQRTPSQSIRTGLDFAAMDDRRRSNNELAFEGLLRDHADTLLALLHAALDDKQAVDDVFQETCLVAWRKLDSYDRSRPFGPWFRGIARKLLLRYRGKWSLQLTDEGLSQVEDRLQDFDGDSGSDNAELHEDLRKCLGRLPDKYRIVLEVKYFDGLTQDAAAERLGISFEAIKKQLLRARSLLRECLERQSSLARREHHGN